MKVVFRTMILAGTVALATLGSAQEISVYIDGERDDGRFPPLLRGGRTMMFLRDTFDRLGAAVKWFPAEKKIKAWQAETEIELWIGKKTAYVNGRAVELDQPPILENYQGLGSATLVPLRFISEALGAGVKYTGSSNRVDIAKSDMAIWNETPPFKVGDTVEILDPVKDLWLKAKVLRVFDFDNALDSYEVEYREEGPNGRLMKPNMKRSHVRKPRS